MCGICGFWTKNGSGDDARRDIERMVDRLRHRGPDDRGCLIDRSESGDVVALGHARLSIIDLQGGHQPIPSEGGGAHVLCNGEIYNYRELRRELEAAGHRFRTHSDCEVIVHLWEDEGPRCVERLRGMFAFVVFDRASRTLFAARDRFGQKPLFYAHAPHGLAFASEIKALLELPWVERHLDPAALDQYLFYQFIPHAHTLFRDVRALPPAHWLRYDGEHVEIERYWQVPFGEPDGSGDDEHLRRVEESLRDAVRSHLVSDVPVGVFLSGGIDSSLVAVMAAQESTSRLHSFSIAFPGTPEDETPFARAASHRAGTEHHEFAYEPAHIEERLESLAATFDQPIADRAALPLSFLSEQAARHTKVVLTGDGGDELFAGYGRYSRGARFGQWGTRLSRLFPVGVLARCGPDPLRLRRLGARLGTRVSPIQESIYSKSYWEAWDRSDLYNDDFRAALNGEPFAALDGCLADAAAPRDPINRMLYVDQLGYLPGNLLPKTDFASMAFGLETRQPLLDHHLAAVAGALPPHLKATARETKVALRRLAGRLLPRELAVREKRGFSVPLATWLRGPLKTWVRDRLLESSRTVPLYFRRAKVERILDEHFSGRRNRAAKIYCLLFFELWHRRYLP